MGYLHHSAQYFPIVNDVINEEDTSGAVPVSTCNLNYTKQPTPNHKPTTPVALKDLLSRTGRSTTRRPSISGIFRSRKYSLANINSSQTNHQKAVEDVRVVSTLSPYLSTNISESETVYAPGTNSEALHPCASPYGGPPEEHVGTNQPRISKSKCGTSMPPRPKIPPRKTFKPPLLNNRTNILFDNGLGAARPITNKPRAKLSEKRTELNMESPQIDIKRIASFVAVQEAW